MNKNESAAGASMVIRSEAKHPVIRAIGRVMAGVLLFNALSPLSVLAQDKGYVSPAAQRQMQQLASLNQDIERAKAEKARSPADRVSEHQKAAQDLLSALSADDRAKRAQTEPATDLRAVGPNLRVETRRLGMHLSAEARAEQQARLKQHLSAIAEGRSTVRAEFESTGQQLRSSKLPAEILARHQEAVAQFEARATEFERLSTAWQSQPGEATLSALADFFERHPAQRRAAPFDPKKLPWSTPKPTTREPAATKTAWFQQLWGDRNVRLAQATNIGPLNFQVPPEPGQAPTEADLAQTPETQRTAAITAKAVELTNNLVAIHNWVRNSIEWMPTWGAIQSAEDTLSKKRGNAHDIASLEVALLRAANIPARYQYGSIELDAEKVQNWVGGVSVPQAAQQLLGQGGIANKGIAAGGKIARIQMEHVWVSAYVNWSPARGAQPGSTSQHVNPNGPLNAWVPLDASYKQYTYTQGLDLKTQVPLDANQLLTAAQQGATVNQSEGWVQNLNQAAIQSQLTAYQTRLKTYIDSQSPNATVGDVIGKKIVPVQTTPLLAGSLPYSVVQQGLQTSAIPSALQHRFTYKVYASAGDRANDSPVLAYTDKTSQIVGKRLTLSYIPASQADADTIASYLPKAHADGSAIQPAEFPSSLPGYLIRLKPQITLDGQVVATSSQSLIMGTDLYSTGGFSQLYDPSQWDLTGEESNVAGNATAIGISAGGVSADQLTKLKDRLEATKTKLQAQNTAGLTGEQISGDLLTATIWSWFAAADSHNRLSQNQAGMVENPALSYGLFHALAEPQYSWGLIRQVKFPGVNMDIGHVRNLSWSKTANTSDWVNYNRLRGQYMSALEHAVPVLIFSDPSWCNLPGSTSPNPALSACPQGISAVKALGIASAQGQRIYTITPQVYSDSPAIVQSQLLAHSFDTRQRVQSYLDAGFEISIHHNPIVQDGWSGAGFAAIDPQTGAGGYLIDGGSNGAIVQLLPSMPVCAGFWSNLWTNFVATNAIIPGLALPVGVTLLTGSFVVETFGGITFLKLAMNWSALVSAGIQGGAILAALIVAAINFVLMSFVFEIGILIGSAAVAAENTCRR
jgi:transglutaminase-like putative cysteine protease